MLFGCSGFFLLLFFVFIIIYFLIRMMTILKADMK